MANKRKREEEPEPTRQRPATTLKAREDQLIQLAVNRAEQQLMEGTASAQVITHYLKLGSSRELLEQERLRHENLMLDAKREAFAGQASSDELYKKALEAFRGYSGQQPVESFDEYEN